MLGDPPTRSARCWGRSTTSRTRPCCTPTSGCSAPPRGVGELELPPRRRADRADDGHLPHEPPPVPGRGPRVPRHPQPHRGDRPREGDPPHLLLPPGVYGRGGARAGTLGGEISGANRTHYRGAYWRWGFHEDGVWSALRVSERIGALRRGRRILTPARVALMRRERGGDLPRPASPPPPGARSSTRSRTGCGCCARPRRAAGESSTATPLWSARRAAPVRFRRADYSATPSSHSPTPPATSSPTAPGGGARGGRARAADDGPDARGRLQPGQLLPPVRRDGETRPCRR